MVFTEGTKAQRQKEMKKTTCYAKGVVVIPDLMLLCEVSLRCEARVGNPGSLAELGQAHFSPGQSAPAEMIMGMTGKIFLLTRARAVRKQN